MYNRFESLFVVLLSLLFLRYYDEFDFGSPPSQDEGGFLRLNYNAVQKPRLSTFDRINQELGLAIEVCLTRVERVAFQLHLICSVCNKFLSVSYGLLFYVILTNEF